MFDMRRRLSRKSCAAVQQLCQYDQWPRAGYAENLATLIKLNLIDPSIDMQVLPLRSQVISNSWHGQLQLIEP